MKLLQIIKLVGKELLRSLDYDTINKIVEFISKFFYSSPQFNFNLISYNSYVTYVIVGENICLSIVLIFFIFNFYLNSLSYNSFPNFEGLHLEGSVIKSSRKVYFNLLGCSLSFNFNIDLVVLFFLYSNLVIFSNNFDFLSSERFYSNSRRCMVLIFKQWGWFSYVNSTSKRRFGCRLFRFGLLGGNNFLVVFSDKRLYLNVFNKISYHMSYHRSLFEGKFFLLITHYFYVIIESINRSIEGSLVDLILNYNEIMYGAFRNTYDLYVNKFRLKGRYGIVDDYIIVHGRKYYFSDLLGYNFMIYCLSLDVIHSLFIKTLVLKLDVFYGKVSYINIKEFLGVLNEGTYLEFICYEYCGLYHHGMYSRFLVLDSLDLSFFSNIFS